ncbi:efflux RND transporter periplasmic adaptor subunit [Dyella sp. BiH032]|uniref:efflux RND transporter periplasmic adaptor subunit n=1 Tax=Dyella sp. BiH032 TaxID=3075430 RepID=UPI002892A1ED|nr:efflux RND transporter periplasmic adaptor subunit [Dyella sp. BiH032]WNL46937.1 efflux RND transporter periplasmic adaptor subunit [Dyella sp. BiH032]
MKNAELLKELRIERDQREDLGRGPGRWPWIAGGVVVLLAAGAAGWMLWGHPAIEVQTAAAVAPSAAGPGPGAVLQATGYITARRQATVSAQITGTLTEVLFEEGDRVEKGQVLARLDDNAYRAALDSAKANALAAEAQILQLQAQLDQARADSSRLRTLVATGLVSRQQDEQARTLVNSTQAQLNAQRKLAAAAQAQATQAQVNFDYTVVRAPFTGVITVKAAQVGEIISPLSAGGGFTRTGVGTIVDMDSLEIDVDVNEAYIGRVKAAMPAEAVLDAYADWKIPAHVIAIVPAADRGKATVKVRVALDQKDPRIVPDMGVRVSFLEQAAPKQAAQPPKGVLVPAGAIAQRDGHDTVFVVSGDVAHQRAVEPAPQAYGEMRLLPAGVQAGEAVVVSPPEELKDGARVKSAATP